MTRARDTKFSTFESTFRYTKFTIVASFHLKLSTPGAAAQLEPPSPHARDGSDGAAAAHGGGAAGGRPAARGIGLIRR